MNSYRRSNGLSSSDIIALAVGIPTGVLTFIGVLLAYLGYRRRRILNANVGNDCDIECAGVAYHLTIQQTRRRTPNSFQPEADETNSTHIDKDSDSGKTKNSLTVATSLVFLQSMYGIRPRKLQHQVPRLAL